MKLCILHSIVVVLLIQTPSLFAKTPDEIFAYAIRGVTYIENGIPGQGTATGSGVLVDRRRRFVVTNQHVTAGEDTMDVFFPARDHQGDLISTRSYYSSNFDQLKQLGFATVGRVIAVDSKKDLAILVLDGLTETAREIDFADSDPRGEETLHILGNPSGRNLWQWASGTFRRIDRFQGSYKDESEPRDYKRLALFSNVYAGNSGGAILNKDAELVAITSSGGGEGGTRANGVHYSEVKKLLSTIRSKKSFTILNASGGSVNYDLEGDGMKENYTLLNGHYSSFTYNDEPPEISFGYRLENGDVVTKKYDLKGTKVVVGKGAVPMVTTQYRFTWQGAALTLTRDNGVRSYFNRRGGAVVPLPEE